MTAPVVTHWLYVLRRAASGVIDSTDIERGIAQFERWKTAGDPRSDQPDIISTIEKARGLVGETDTEHRKAVVNLVSRARLFDLSDEIMLAAARRADDVVGTPDLAELPFEVCWFRAEYHDPKSDLDVLGYLISRTGWMGVCYRDRDGNPDFSCGQIVNDDGWEASAVQGAWSLWLASRVVAGHVAARTPTASFSVRRDLARARAAGAPVVPPPELYTLRLDARRAGHALGRIIEARNGPSYRYEVRRHERMLVHRGRWPVDPDLAADFRRRGYTVERGDALDERAVLGIDLRGLPPGQRGEWIAWKFAPVKEHEAGPKDAPVRRAVRVSG